MTDDTRLDLPGPGDPEFATLILAYADGELTEADIARAEALLDRSPEAQALYDTTIDQMDALSDIFDMGAKDMIAAAPDPFAAQTTAEVETTPPAPETTPAPSPAKGLSAPPRPAARTDARAAPARGRLAGLIPLALTAAAALVAGIAIGPLVSPSPGTQVADAPAPAPAPTPLPVPAAAPEAPGWRMSVAIYQRLYSEATFASAPVAPEANFATWNNAAPLFSLEPNVVNLPDGLELKRIQLLEVNGRPLLQIAFVVEGGRTVSLCIFPRGDGGGPPAPELVTGEILDLNTVDWQDANNAFLLIGDADTAPMVEIAQSLADQLI